jgi:hypothetical protein
MPIFPPLTIEHPEKYFVEIILIKQLLFDKKYGNFIQLPLVAKRHYLSDLSQIFPGQ